MIKNNNRKKLYRQIVLAGLVSIFGSHALAQQVTLQNNQLQISGGSGTTFSSQSPTISALGVVQTIIDVPTTNGVGIPSFNFTMVPNSVPDGVYSYRVGVTFDDTANDRRLEAEIGTLQLTVSGGNIVSGTIPGSQALRVLGRNGAGTLQVQINVTNSSTNGPITINGGSVSFNASNLISRIRNSHSQFDSIILAEFDQPATYDYRIAVQQTGTTAAGSPTLAFGTGTSFAAFPQVQAPGCSAANCVGNTTAFLLNTNELASDYTAAYTVKGSFNVATVSSGGSSGGSTGGTGTTGNVVTDTTNLGNTVDNITVTTGTPPSTETVTQINDAVTTTNTLLTNTATQITSGSVTTTQALSTLTTVNKALDLAGTATSAGGTVDTTSTTTAITNIATVLEALATKGTLTDAEKTTVTTLVTSTVSSAVKLITSSTSSSSVLSLIQATTNLLEQTQASSGVISTELSTQLKTLGETAGKTIVNALPESIRGNTDATSIDAIRTLVNTSPTAKAQVVQTAPSLIRQKSVKSSKDPGLGSSNTLVSTSVSPIASKQTANILAGGIGSAFTAALQGFGLTPSGGPSQQGLSIEALSGPYNFQVVPDTNFMEITAGSEKFITLIAAIRIVSDLVPNGNSFLPNGQALVVNDGYAFELGGAPVNNTAFTQAITDAGYAVTYLEGGRITVSLGNDERFAGAFGFQNIAGDGSCTTASFAAGTSALNSPDYAFEMTCSNGVKQRIVPAVENTAFYNTLVTAGLEASTSKDTGIISITGIGSFKPSFFVHPLTAEDTAFHAANQNSDGVAIRPVDANGDGKTDYEILTSGTKQLVYGL